MIEIWATTKEIDNLMCNKWSKELMDDDRLKEFEFESSNKKLRRKLPNHVPAKVFENVDDGDIIYMEYDKYAIEFTINQKSYRYNRFGSFKSLYEILKKDLNKRLAEV